MYVQSLVSFEMTAHEVASILAQMSDYVMSLRNVVLQPTSIRDVPAARRPIRSVPGVPVPFSVTRGSRR